MKKRMMKKKMEVVEVEVLALEGERSSSSMALSRDEAVLEQKRISLDWEEQGPRQQAPSSSPFFFFFFFFFFSLHCSNDKNGNVSSLFREMATPALDRDVRPK